MTWHIHRTIVLRQSLAQLTQPLVQWNDVDGAVALQAAPAAEDEVGLLAVEAQER